MPLRSESEGYHGGGYRRLIGLALRLHFRQLAAMIRGLFRLLMQLIALVVVVFALTAVYIVYDGLQDKGTKADCAVVLGNALKADGQPGPILHERLDLAAKLYSAQSVPLIIVSGGREADGADEAAGMAAYLQKHGVPADAIVEDPNGIHTAETAHDVAAIMHQRGLHSVMIVSHYYHITRTKVALQHEGIHQVDQAHVGTFVKDDAFDVVREAAALWYYIYQENLQPMVAKATVQAQAEAQVLKEKLSSEATQAKDTVQKDTKDK
jgi:vancomycin permeability regulator SanA